MVCYHKLNYLCCCLFIAVDIKGMQQDLKGMQQDLNKSRKC